MPARIDLSIGVHMSGSSTFPNGKRPATEGKSFQDLIREKLGGRDGSENWYGLTLPEDVRAKFPVQPVENPRAVPTGPRPECNSKILENVNGTLFTVIGGIAYGFTSDTVFRRIHYRCYDAWYPACCPNNCGGGAHLCVHYRVCPRFYRFEDYADIQRDIMDPHCRLRISPINRAVYLLRSGFRHGIHSALAFDNYQFDWDDVREFEGSEAEWNQLEDGAEISEEVGGRYDP
jgi:hypothetical protein